MNSKKETVEISKIDALSVAKVAGMMAAIVGLFLGILIALGLSGTPILSGIGYLSVVILTIEFGVLGFLLGGIHALLYNIIVKYTGGMKIEMKP